MNTAIALMGKSSIVLLDEPSNGMDLVAKRHLWNTVTSMCKTGKTIIVTSHRYGPPGGMLEGWKGKEGTRWSQECKLVDLSEYVSYTQGTVGRGRFLAKAKNPKLSSGIQN